MDKAYLELIIGPMMAGKTSYLVKLHKQYSSCNIPVMVINHIQDDRYMTSQMLTHDHTSVPCLWADKLVEIPVEEINKVSVILINEGQFFKDLSTMIKKWLSMDKKIYIAGLDGDFKREKFGEMLDLIPLCDKVTKLLPLCGMCKNGTPAIYTKRKIIDDDKQVLIGGSDKYVPVCRKCYNDNY